MCGANLAIHDSLTVSGYASLGGQLQVDGTLTLLAGASVYGGVLDLSGQAHLGTGSQLTFAGDSILHGGQAVINGAGKAILNGGTLTIEGNESISNLDVSDGALQGPGSLTVSGVMNWLGGSWTQAGILDVAVGAELDINATTAVDMHFWTINNDGLIKWMQGEVDSDNSTVNNKADGEFIISSESLWHILDQTPSSSINNDGVVTSDGSTSIEVSFTNNNLVDVNGGSFTLLGGGSYCGIFDIAANADVTLGGGLFTALQGGQNWGQGQFIIGNGGQATVDVGAEQLVRHNNVVLNTGGSITGAGQFQMSGLSAWRGGSMSSSGVPGQTVNVGVFQIDNNNAILNRRTLVNDSIMVWNAAFAGALPNITWTVTGGGVVNNRAWDIVTVSGRTLRLNTGNPGVPSTLGNTDRINVTGSGTVVFNMEVINNSGTIDVQGGTLTFSNTVGGFTNTATGRITAAADTWVTFLQGDYEFRGVSSGTTDRELDGAGTFVAGDGAQVGIRKNNFVRANRFQMLTGSTLTGAGSFNARIFSWIGGTMQSAFIPTEAGVGTTLLESGDVMTIEGNVSLEDRFLSALGGRIEWNPTAYTITVSNSATIVVDGGVFEIFNLNGVLENSVVGDDSCTIQLRNNGILQKQYLDGASSTDVTTINIPIQNASGQVLADGALTFTRPYTQSGQATISLGNARYSFFQLNTSGDGTPGSTVNLNGGDLTVTNQGGTPTVQYNTIYNLSGVVHGWLLSRPVEECRIHLQGNVDFLDGNNLLVQVNLVRSFLYLHGFTMNIAQGRISNFTAAGPAGVGIYLQGGVLNFQGPMGDGRIRGPGTVNGNAIMGPGAMLDASAPGQTGTTTIGGDLTMQPGSGLNFQLGAADYDQLIVAGNVTLAGTLNVILLDYTPVEGDVFYLITCASYQGAFDNSTIDLGDGYYLQVDYSDPTCIQVIVQVY